MTSSQNIVFCQKMTKLVSSLENSSQTGSKEIYKIQQCKIPFENNITKNEKKKKKKKKQGDTCLNTKS